MAYLILMTDGDIGSRFSINKPCMSIGRSPECDIYLDDPSVSHYHAVIDFEELEEPDLGHFFLKDTESTNGTFVNNEKVEFKDLHHNDTIVIGLSNFKFVDEHETELEKTQRIKKSWIPGVFYLTDRQ